MNYFIQPDFLNFFITKKNIDYLWSSMETIQEQNEKLLLSMLKASPFPVNEELLKHTERWISIFKKSYEDTREINSAFLDHTENRLKQWQSFQPLKK